MALCDGDLIRYEQEDLQAETIQKPSYRLKIR